MKSPPNACRSPRSTLDAAIHLAFNILSSLNKNPKAVKAYAHDHYEVINSV